MNKSGKLARSALLALLLVSASRPALASDLLAGLGTNNFSVTSSNALTYSQTATNLTLGASFTIQSSVGGFFSSSYNWTNVPSFGLLISAPGVSPNKAFKIEFFDLGENLLNEYQGFAQDLTSASSFVPVTVTVNPLASGDLSAVSAFQFTWGGDGSGSIEMAGIVPEPSTWALLGLGALLSGLLWVRHRRKA